MKRIFLINVCWLLYMTGIAQTGSSITDVNDSAISINSLQGKKILLIILPLEKDTALINQLLRFQKKYEKKVQVIGLVMLQQSVPSREFYKETYSKASTSGIIVTNGLQPAGKAADVRESVIQWLTGKSNNRQLDRYAAGSKYFLSEDGWLYAQLGKGVSLDDQIVKNLANTIVPRAVSNSPKKTPAGADTSKDSTRQHF